MAVVILGGTGLVGSAVVRELIKNNQQVVATSRAGRPSSEQVQWLAWDGSNTNTIENLSNIDCIVHLANEVVTSRQTLDVQVAAFARNAITNINVLNLCYKIKVPKLIWVGSSTGYSEKGVKHEKNFTKGRLPKANLLVAAEARAFEIQLRAVSQLIPIDITVLRPTTIIGPINPQERPPKHAAVKLILAMLNGEEAIIYRPEVARDYIFSKDVARIIAKEIYMETMPFTCDAFNIGSGTPVTLSDIALSVRNEIGPSAGPIRYVSAGKQPSVQVLPLKKGQNRYGKDRSQFQEGIKELIDSFRERKLRK